MKAVLEVEQVVLQGVEQVACQEMGQVANGEWPPWGSGLPMPRMSHSGPLLTTTTTTTTTTSTRSKVAPSPGPQALPFDLRPRFRAERYCSSAQLYWLQCKTGAHQADCAACLCLCQVYALKQGANPSRERRHLPLVWSFVADEDSEDFDSEGVEAACQSLGMTRGHYRSEIRRRWKYGCGEDAGGLSRLGLDYLLAIPPPQRGLSVPGWVGLSYLSQSESMSRKIALDVAQPLPFFLSLMYS